jgi:predicted RNase H-like nuclease (RuvC/YqgF family)
MSRRFLKIKTLIETLSPKETQSPEQGHPEVGLFAQDKNRPSAHTCRDNLQHKETIQALRAELAAVHVEILEVRKENAALRKRLRETHLRVQDDVSGLNQLVARGG